MLIKLRCHGKLTDRWQATNLTYITDIVKLIIHKFIVVDPGQISSKIDTMTIMEQMISSTNIYLKKKVVLIVTLNFSSELFSSLCHKA